MTRLLAAALLLSASAAFAQVRVVVRPEKSAFLEGEPVFLEARITNAGAAPVTYGLVGHDLKLEIPGRRAYEWREACGPLPISGSMSLVDHPPTLPPEGVVTFRYLLRGYRLKPGRHDVRVSGNAPVRAQGQAIDVTVPVQIVAATEKELRALFTSTIAMARSNYSELPLELVGLLESAPPFLLDVIVELAGHPTFRAASAYDALADINTARSRAELRRLYDETTNIKLRRVAIDALSRFPNADNRDFLESLLQGQRQTADGEIRAAAVDGLNCIRNRPKLR
jgi:hypothetical protein